MPPFWFAEASAVWASYLGNRGDAAALTEPHAMFVDFQKDKSPLDSADAAHCYLAWIWALFMEQEGGAASVGAAWKAMAGCADQECLGKAVDSAVPFDARFRDFAVRNLNEALGEPLRRRYRDVERSFPDGTRPTYEVNGVLPTIARGQEPDRHPIAVPHLQAQYFRWTVPGATGEVRLDLSTLDPEALADADLLERIAGKWGRRSIGVGKERWCRNKAEERIEEIILVVSNHATAADSTVKGGLAVSGFAESCKPGWQGTIIEDFTVSETWDRTTPSGDGGSRTEKGASSSHTTVTIDVGDPTTAVIEQTRRIEATEHKTSSYRDNGRRCEVVSDERSHSDGHHVGTVKAWVDQKGLDKALEAEEVTLVYGSNAADWSMTTVIEMEGKDSCSSRGLERVTRSSSMPQSGVAMPPLLQIAVDPKDRTRLKGSTTTKRGDGTLTITWDLRRR